jgi:hypothetical protein
LRDLSLWNRRRSYAQGRQAELLSRCMLRWLGRAGHGASGSSRFCRPRSGPILPWILRSVVCPWLRVLPFILVHSSEDCHVLSSHVQDELTLRIAAYAGTSALAGVIGGFVSYGFSFVDDSRLAKWQWLFIGEGIPTILVGIATVWVLPDRPEQGIPRGFTGAEHTITLARRSRYVDNTGGKGINWSHVRA